MKAKLVIICSMFVLAACSQDPSFEGKITVRGYSMETETAGIYLFDPYAHLTESMHRITPEDIYVGNYAWSRDGKQLVFNCEKENAWTGICRVDRDGENIEILISDSEFGKHMSIFNPMALSPNGESIIFAIYSSTDLYTDDLYHFNIKTGNLQLLLQLDSEIHQISWSPDESTVALTLYQYEIHVLDLTTLDLDFLTDGYYGVWSSEGEYLALSWQVSSTYLYAVEDGHKVVTFNDQDICMESESMALSPDGVYMLFTSVCGESDKNHGLYIGNMVTRKVKRLDKLNRTPSVVPESVDSPAWIPEQDN